MQSHNQFQTLMEMTPRKLFFFFFSFLLTEIYIHEVSTIESVLEIKCPSPTKKIKEIN